MPLKKRQALLIMPFSFPMALSSPAPYLLSESSWSADDVKKIYTVRACRHCGNAFIAGRPNSVFCCSRFKSHYKLNHCTVF